MNLTVHALTQPIQHQHMKNHQIYHTFQPIQPLINLHYRIYSSHSMSNSLIPQQYQQNHNNYTNVYQNNNGIVGRI